MVNYGRIGSINIKEFIIDILIGSKRKKIVSSTILIIIAFLIHVQSRKSNT
jgi:hypothetical protein